MNLEDVQMQTTFGANGEIEEPESVETTFDDWGVEVSDARLQETRYLVEQASEFGIDDRSLTPDRGDRGEQGGLFVDVDEDQVDLSGQRVGSVSKW